MISTLSEGTHGAHWTGSVLVKKITDGTPRFAAKWPIPESLPKKSLEPPSSLDSSNKDLSCRSRTLGHSTTYFQSANSCRNASSSLAVITGFHPVILLNSTTKAIRIANGTHLSLPPLPG